MNLSSHSRRQNSDALIRYNHILNKQTLNNILDISQEQRHNIPIYEQTNAYNVLTYENIRR